MAGDCRIHSLRIRTDDQAILPRSVFLIEDAFRTASFACIPANGQVFIKKLDVGGFPASVDSSFLSRRIDNLLRHLTPVRVKNDAPDQPDEDAVWFADALEPCRLLVQLLAGGRRPKALYWPVAVPGWSRHATLSQSLQLIISHLASQTSCLTGVAHVLEPLVERQVLLEAIEHFAPNQIDRWLGGAGFDTTVTDMREVGLRATPAEIKSKGLDSRPVCNLPGSWSSILTKSLRIWRANDPRVWFIAYLGLSGSDHRTSPARAREIIRDAISLNRVA